MAVIFAIACVLLSMWQFGRRAEAVAAIEKVAANYDQAPQPLSDVLPTTTDYDATQEWIPVVMTGTYLSDEQLLVRNRPFNGQPGFDVLTPLLLDDGSVFIVDRGWVATGSEQDYPDAVPSAPEGDVTVVARLKASERSLPGRSAPDGQIATIELPAIAERLDRPMYSAAYGLMDSEDPAAAGRPEAAIKPDADEGNHLSYAFQWIMFALVGFAGLGYAIRTEYRIRNAEDPAEKARAAERDRKAAARAPSDSDVEDAILDRTPRP